eukprot:scaffold529_cov308-Pinguiococcus_pyrenoidosus.AAC.73
MQRSASASTASLSVSSAPWSPALALLTTISPETFSVGCAVLAIFSMYRSPSALPDAYASTQPFWPQPQRRPPGCTMTWPPSMQPRLPWRSLPPERIPVPTPVPSVSSTMSSTSRMLSSPVQTSASKAASASLTRKVGRSPHRCCSS